MPKNGMIECNNCGSKLVAPSPRSVSRAYHKHRSQVSSKHRALNFLLVVGDCILVGLQVAYIDFYALTSESFEYSFGPILCWLVLSYVFHLKILSKLYLCAFSFPIDITLGVWIWITFSHQCMLVTLGVKTMAACFIFLCLTHDTCKNSALYFTWFCYFFCSLY